MTGLLAWWRSHRKAVVAAAGLVLTVASLAAPDNKWVAAAVSAAAALGVYVVPNKRPG
jgi:type IV secretory pathway protease TraF